MNNNNKMKAIELNNTGAFFEIVATFRIAGMPMIEKQTGADEYIRVVQSRHANYNLMLEEAEFTARLNKLELKNNAAESLEKSLAMMKKEG